MDRPIEIPETTERVNHLVGELLLFRQDGAFHVWRDNRELEPGTELLALMSSLTDGWVQWKNRKVVAEVMGRVADGFHPPPRHLLPNPSEAWVPNHRLTLIDLIQGSIYTFTTSSDGGRKAVIALCQEYGRHLRVDRVSLPIIELGSNNYYAHHKTIWNPVFQIVGWR